MEVVNWQEYEEKNHVLAWFLIEVMSHVGMEKFEDFDPKELKVEFKVNGVDIPVVPAFQLLQDQWNQAGDARIYRKKQEIKDKLQELINDIIFEEE